MANHVKPTATVHWESALTLGLSILLFSLEPPSFGLSVFLRDSGAPGQHESRAHNEPEGGFHLVTSSEQRNKKSAVVCFGIIYIMGRKKRKVVEEDGGTAPSEEGTGDNASETAAVKQESTRDGDADNGNNKQQAPASSGYAMTSHSGVIVEAE